MARDLFAFELVGARQLERNIDRAAKLYGSRKTKTALKRALRRRLKPIARQMKAAAPVDEGDLKRSIGVSDTLTRGQKRGRRGVVRAADVEMFVGARIKQGRFAGQHAHLIEFGTAKMPARPFMRPVWDAHERRLLAGVIDDMLEELAKELRKFSAKAEAGRLSKRDVRRLTGG